jgi:chromosome partitioning protein
LVRARAADTPELVETSPDNLRAVVKAAADAGVNFVVVDTRPSVERDTAEVARVADFALIPTRPSILDLRAIGATVDVVKALDRRAAIILNACPAARGAGEHLSRSKRAGGWKSTVCQ